MSEPITAAPAEPAEDNLLAETRAQNLHLALVEVLLAVHPRVIRDMREGRTDRQPSFHKVPRHLLAQLLTAFDRSHPGMLDRLRTSARDAAAGPAAAEQVV